MRLRSSSGIPGPLSMTSSTSCSRSRAGVDRDRAAARRELDRIGQQIVEDQAQLAAVGERGQILDLHVEPHALRDQRQLLVLEHLT